MQNKTELEYLLKQCADQVAQQSHTRKKKENGPIKYDFSQQERE